MFRRILLYNDRGAVKWVVIAAVFGLTMGYVAEHRLATRAGDEPAAAEKLIEVRPAVVHGAS